MILERGGSLQILNGWKEIALHLGRGVRTVQRYEVSLGLPVRRPSGHDRSSVIAFVDEIDAWLQACPKKRETAPLAEPNCDAVLDTLEQALEHARKCQACNSRISATLLKTQSPLVA